MITREEILMGREKHYPINKEIEGNLNRLLEALNKFRLIYSEPMVVTSGYRPKEINDKIGGAKNSDHMYCLACDFSDKDGELDYFCTFNTDVLAECGLYLEHPKWTKNWCHLQIAKPKSGSRIFIPSNTNPSKESWDKTFNFLKV